MIAPAGVRARATAAVAIAALLVSTSMALLTFQLTRSYLTSQRDRLATRQAQLNARLLQDVLPGATPEGVPEALNSLSQEAGSQVLLFLDGRWLGSSVGVDETDMPAGVRRVVATGDGARQRASIDGRPFVVVGVPLLDGRAAYYELFPLDELERTLNTMALSLAASAAVTTVAGAAFGARFSRRVLQPVSVTSQVARRISQGELQLRLPETRDPEIAPLYESFNGMIDALSARIERERRFAADVSHELRTPLTALVSSMAILERHRHALPERGQVAVQILDAQLDHFRSLVLDLLDMSRMESGVEEARLDPVDIRELVDRVLVGRPTAPPAIEVRDVPCSVLLDGRRVERVVSNLLDNAEAYAGGAVAITITGDDGVLALAVDDAGPGVEPDERIAIFERLHRGNAARRSGNRGSGLGLALAAEHLRLQGGSIRVDAAPTGGARFVVELPLRPAEVSG